MPIVHIDANSFFDENNPNHKFIKEIIWVFFRDNDNIKASIEDLIAAQKRDSEYVRQHTHYAVQASFWDKQKRHDDYLLRGDNLQKAELWLEKSKKFTEDILENETNPENKNRKLSIPKPTKLHRDYIIKSREVEDKNNEELKNLREAKEEAGAKVEKANEIPSRSKLRGI